MNISINQYKKKCLLASKSLPVERKVEKIEQQVEKVENIKKNS